MSKEHKAESLIQRKFPTSTRMYAQAFHKFVLFKLTPVVTRLLPDRGRIPEGGLPVNPIPLRETGRDADDL